MSSAPEDCYFAASPKKLVFQDIKLLIGQDWLLVIVESLCHHKRRQSQQERHDYRHGSKTSTSRERSPAEHLRTPAPSLPSSSFLWDALQSAAMDETSQSA